MSWPFKKPCPCSGNCLQGPNFIEVFSIFLGIKAMISRSWLEDEKALYNLNSKSAGFI